MLVWEEVKKMNTITFNSIFDIYPDGTRWGAVIGYRYASRPMLTFPFTWDVGDAVPDDKGRFHSRDIGLKPVCVSENAKIAKKCNETGVREIWLGESVFQEKVRTCNNTVERICFLNDIYIIGQNALAMFLNLKEVVFPDSDDLMVCEEIFGPLKDQAFQKIKFYGRTSIYKILGNIKDKGKHKYVSPKENLFYYADTLEHHYQNDTLIWYLPGHATKIVECIDGEKVAFYMDKIKDRLALTGLTPYGESLKELTVPDYVEELSYGAFADSKAKVIILPSSIKVFGKNLFMRCENLRFVYQKSQ